MKTLLTKRKKTRFKS
ncbi:UNVERIFIED_CONTAM: hypothetical protein GTU68_042378 [Idotea baltica]|nr:hypothetical protein [Idotea baltica]